MLFDSGDVPPLTIIHTNDKPNGAVHWLDEEKTNFSCIVLPRNRVLRACNQNNTKKVLEVLNTIQKTGTTCTRGRIKKGTSSSGSKHTIFGWNVLRGGRGLGESKSYKESGDDLAVVTRWVRRLEDIVNGFLPIDLYRGAVSCQQAGRWPVLGKGIKFSSAMATSIDYCAPSHVDADFLFSIHQLNVEGDGHLYQDAEVVQYFCFPQLGYAIGMRPGDVIIFNSNCYHSLSTKRDLWRDHRVHVTSFYTKTAHVGGNDNSKDLTDEEKYYYNLNLML
jgi:hypothetical protein